MLLLGIPQLIVGVWAVVAPSHWHLQVGGPPMAPFNEHLVVDVGMALTAFGSLLVGAAAYLRLKTLRLVLTGWLGFALPHAGYHWLNTSEWGGEVIFNLGSLTLFAVLPVLLLAGLSSGGWLRRPKKPPEYKESRRR